MLTPVRFDGIPVVNLEGFLSGNPNQVRATAEDAMGALIETSAVIVVDPRVQETDFNECRDLLIDYFQQPRELLLPDVHPEFHHQVGLSLEGAEGWRRSLLERANGLPPEHQPHIPPKNYAGDQKLRFFIRLGEADSRNPNDPLNQAAVIPQAFHDRWQSVTESWGSKLLSTGETVLAMIEHILGTERRRLRDMTIGAPHLLGPNAADLDQLTVPGTIVNAYHYDLNSLSIHGPATYPGLRIWLRNGTSLWVKVPPGCILIQVGQQLEHLTGGLFTAGMHEVVVSDTALAARQRGASPLRISSPCFQHFASHHQLEVLPQIRDYLHLSEADWQELQKQYPPMLVGEQVERELRMIGLAIT